MSKLARFSLLILLISGLSMLGCNGVSTGANTPPASPVSTFQVVTIADLHFNPLYDPTLFPQLAAADPSQWYTIFANSAVKIPTAGGTDTNFPLLMLTLASIKQNVTTGSKSPIVLFTGDLLGHNIPTNYCKIYAPLNNTTTANCAATQTAAIQQFITNTFTFVATQTRENVGSTVPVIYAPGNIDAYSGGAGPDTTFLTLNEPAVYSQFLNSSVNEQIFKSTFTADGYYSVAPLGSKLLVIALNSNSFVAKVPSSTAATPELTWLDSQLAAAQAAGQKVWILMHVPPGANSQGIAQVAATPSDVDASDVSMMWDQTVQSTFVSTLAKYPGVVTMMLAGHTHMDEFRILPTGDVLEQLPGISPCFGNNPAYKVITVTQDTFTPTDYQSYDYDLAAMPAQFGTLYQFSTTYAAGSTLANSLTQLYPQFATNPNTVETYTLLYASGSTAVSPITFTPWNPINDVNWPIFACTVDDVEQADYLECVSSYGSTSADSIRSSHSAR